MAAGLSVSEEFMVLFNRLKEVTGNSPDQVPTLFNARLESNHFLSRKKRKIRDALAALHAFLARTRIEAHLSGSKVVRASAAGFPTAWKESSENWRFRVTPDIWAMDLTDSGPFNWVKYYREW